MPSDGRNVARAVLPIVRGHSMNRRQFLRLILFGSAAAGGSASWAVLHGRKGETSPDPDDWERRVYFVCCDDHGDYSSGVYMRVGGGRSAFATVRQAAPFMRADDPGSAAAGLCGYLFQHFECRGET